MTKLKLPYVFNRTDQQNETNKIKTEQMIVLIALLSSQFDGAVDIKRRLHMHSQKIIIDMS